MLLKTIMPQNLFCGYGSMKRERERKLSNDFCSLVCQIGSDVVLKVKHNVYHYIYLSLNLYKMNSF